MRIEVFDDSAKSYLSKNDEEVTKAEQGRKVDHCKFPKWKLEFSMIRPSESKWSSKSLQFPDKLKPGSRSRIRALYEGGYPPAEYGGSGEREKWHRAKPSDGLASAFPKDVPIRNGLFGRYEGGLKQQERKLWPWNPVSKGTTSLRRKKQVTYVLGSKFLEKASKMKCENRYVTEPLWGSA